MKMEVFENGVLVTMDDGMVSFIENELYQNVLHAIYDVVEMTHCSVFSPTDCAIVLDTAINELYPDGFDESKSEEVCVLASMLAWACCNNEKELALQIIFELVRCS